MQREHANGLGPRNDADADTGVVAHFGDVIKLLDHHGRATALPAKSTFGHDEGDVSAGGQDGLTVEALNYAALQVIAGDVAAVAEYDRA